jgi:DnaJ family protein C protein 28
MPNIDDLINNAMREGKFDDLGGKGKPLKLDDDSSVDPEWRVAHHILKSSGFTLPWIETRQEIQNSIENTRAELSRSWAWRGQALRENQNFQQVEAEWQRALSSFSNKLQDLNKQIQSYNLEAPSTQLQLPPLSLEREISAIIGS